MDKTSKKVRPTIDMAATAASPYPEAATFSATVAMLASPCLQSEGVPRVRMSKYSFDFLEMFPMLILMLLLRNTKNRQKY